MTDTYKWIPCSEAMPEDKGYYDLCWVTTRYGDVETMVHNNSKYGSHWEQGDDDWVDEFIVAWMPYYGPDPYKVI